MDLSVIIICKDEEKNIARCVESAISGATGFKYEILLVDVSTDKTVEIAKKYPVKIIKQKKDKYLSPSSGRYIGTLNSTGKYVLFIDADVVLIKDFIKRAIEYFKNPIVGGVRGKLYNINPEENINKKHPERDKQRKEGPLGGQASMYSREALEKVGTFNPFVKGEEERELYHRMSTGGYKLIHIDDSMGYHFFKVRDKKEIDEKSGYYVGVGQIIRKYFLRRPFFDVIKAQKRIFIEQLITILLIIILIFLIISKKYLFLISIAILLFILLVSLSIWKGHNKVYLFIRSRLYIFINIIKGIILGIEEEKDYLKKTNIKFIKR